VGESRKTFCLTEDDRPVTLQEREGEAVKPSELKAILDQHHLWIESGQAQGKRADLRYADLRGASLRGASLRGAYLRGAYLQGADLHDTYLHDTYLQGANLWGADFRGADLHGANLQGAYLEGANLQGADLQGAYLQGADLQGAYLQGATFDLNFKQVGWFYEATFSEDQIAWVCLHPKYPEWADTLKWVKAEKLSA
jgi:uncharacterized protein YjbI with pentapeptide repeats